jgi:zinc transporter ZupT
MSEALLSFFAAFIFALIHVFGGKLRFLHVIPRSRFLSAAGGVSVAYVFIQLLPELAEGQQVIERGLYDQTAGELIQHHVYLLSLAGLVTFYGLEVLLRSHKKRRQRAVPSNGVFWLHIGSFALYNMLIGYVLVEQQQEGGLWPFVIAIGMHLFVTDNGLRSSHRHLYVKEARWLLAAAVLAGWAAGVLAGFSELAFAITVGFVSGAIILNVLKEELPEDRESRLAPFLLGALGFSILMIFL